MKNTIKTLLILAIGLFAINTSGQSVIKKEIFSENKVSWNIQKLSFLQDNNLGLGNVNKDLFITPDGVNYFIPTTEPKIRKYIATVPYDISTLVFSQEIITPKIMTCIFISPDGLTIYSFGGQFTSTWGMYLYKLTTPYDLSTLTSTTFLIDGVRPNGLYFAPNGLNYIVCNSSGLIRNYSLSVAWDYESTRTLVQSINLTDNFTGVQFREKDGLKMYLSNRTDDTIDEYNLTSPFDLNTIDFVSSYFTNTATSWVEGIFIRQDGLKFYSTLQTGSEVLEYDWK